MASRRTIPIVDAAAARDGGCDAAEPFALMVLGDSMAPEFIDGDVVVVEPDGHAGEGAYVVAMADGEWTLRRLGQDETGWVLAPLDARYTTLPIADFACIRGVVIQRTHPRQRARRKRYFG